MLLSALATISAGFSGTVSKVFTDWSDRSNIKAETKSKLQQMEYESQLKIAEIEAQTRRMNAEMLIEQIKAGQKIDYDQDMEMLRQQQKSYKDEFLLILFSAPVIASFIPHLQPYIEKGWEMLNKAPDWFLMLYAGMVVTIYGLRGIARSIIESRLFKKK